MQKYRQPTPLSSALQIVGMGQASTLVLFACGFAFSLPHLLPNQLYFYRNELEKNLYMTIDDKKVNNICTYVAMIAGGLIAAGCSEVKGYGRRLTLIILLFIHTVCLVFILLVNNKMWYLLFKTASSFSGSGASFVGALYCAEFQQTDSRGFMLVALQMFCKAAILLLPAQQFVSLLPLVAVIIMVYLPENPLYLLSMGCEREALRALEKIYTINTNKDGKLFRIQVPRLKTDLETVTFIKKGVLQRAPGYCIAVLMLANFTFTFSYYTLVMWYPELFPRHDFFHQIPLFPSGDYVCDYGYFNDKSYTGNQTIVKRFNTNRGYGKKEDFIQLMLTVSMSLPVLAWMIHSIDTLGRKFFIVFSHLFGSFLVFWSYYIHETLGLLVFSCALYACITISTTAILCLAVEVCKKRAWSLAIVYLGGEIGAVLGSSGLVLYFNNPCFYFTSVLGIMVEVAGLIVTTIPSTEGIPLC